MRFGGSGSVTQQNATGTATFTQANTYSGGTSITSGTVVASNNNALGAGSVTVGSGGTLTGLSHFFARVAPAVEMVLADPLGSILAGYIRTGQIGEAGSWLVVLTAMNGFTRLLARVVRRRSEGSA